MMLKLDFSITSCRSTETVFAGYRDVTKHWLPWHIGLRNGVLELVSFTLHTLHG